MKIAFRLASNEGQGCPFCVTHPFLDGSEDFVGAAKHLQDAHALECLHVGTESHNTQDGELWHSTVAIFGER